MSTPVSPRHWLAVLRPENWDVLASRNFDVLGLSSRWARTVREKVRPKDRVFVYVSSHARFLGLFEVAAPVFQSDKRIWEAATYPIRIPLRPILVLSLNAGVTATETIDELSFVSNKRRWGSVFFRSIQEISAADAQLLATRMAKRVP